MAQLLDQYGKPVRTSDLTRQVSGPTMLGQRPAIITTPIGGLTPATLAALLNAADTGDSLAWLECAEELERRDLHYLGVLNTRKRTIAQLPITVTPASDDDAHKKHADFVSAWLDRGVLEKSLFDMMDAVGKGWSVHEIVWHAEAGNYYPRNWPSVRPGSLKCPIRMARQSCCATIPAARPRHQHLAASFRKAIPRWTRMRS